MFQFTKTHSRYSKYTPTNIDWIGDIPDEWGMRKIAQLCYIGRGRVIAKTDMVDQGGLFPIYSSQTADNGVIGYLNTYDFDGEYLTWTTDGANAGTVFYRTGKFNATNVCGTLKVKEDICLLFLKYALSVSTKRHVREDINPKLMNNMMASITIPFSTDIQNQQKIATYLNEKTALLDEAIAKKLNQIDLLSEHRTALINSAITKGLDLKVKMKDSGVEWIGMIPKEWEVKKLKYVSSILNGYAFDSSSYQDTGLPIVRIGDVGQEIDFENIKRVPVDLVSGIQKFQILQGDILLALTGATIGKSSVFSYSEIAYLNQRVGILRSHKISQKYLRYFVSSNIFRENISVACFGGAQENIGKPQVGNIELANPNIEEQQQIVDYLDKETGYIDSMKAKIERSIELLEEYKISLISHAVSGKIMV